MAESSLDPFFVEMTLYSGGVAIPLRADEFLQSLEIEEGTRGAWTGTVVLWDAEGDYLENLVIAAGLDRALKLRLGRGAAAPTEVLEYTGEVVTYQTQPDPNGVTLTLELVTSGVLRALVDKRPRSFDAGMLVSDMVQQIATDRQWDTVIEPTSEPVTQPFSSTGESDMQFINEQLRPQARNAAGEGGYLFFFDSENVMHFRTPDYLNPEVHNFTYARDLAGDVIGFAPSDVSLFGKLMGGGNASFGSAGSLLGGSTQVSASVVSGVSGAGSSVQSDGSAKVDYGEGVHAYVDFAARDAEELARLAQSRYDALRRYEYKATLTVQGTHRVRMSDHVDVEWVKRDGRLHYLSGRFQVFKRKHTVGEGAWETEYEVLRFGLRSLAGTVRVTATQVKTPASSSGSTGLDLEVET